MKVLNKYIDLCGIGNGLVDIQVEVPEFIISEFGLKKGGMQLADTEQQKKLLILLADYKQHKSSGGSAANTIIAFSQFGGKSAYQTVLGNDELGMFYANEFKELGIELFYEIEEKYATGNCLILITPDAERTMVTALGASAFFNKKRLNIDLIESSKWLYIEGYEFSQKESTDAVFEAVKAAKKFNTKIALTFSDSFITELFYDNINKIADQSDLIFCNQAELLSFTKKNNFDEALKIFDKRFPNFAVTKGSEGSVIKWDKLIHEIPPYPSHAKDSTGAGDIYAGGFLYGIIKTGSPTKAGHLGSIAAGKVVSQLGARLKEYHKNLTEKIFTEIK
jgi:sugar/nucleoside kinase (ribokinase family)